MLQAPMFLFYIILMSLQERRSGNEHEGPESDPVPAEDLEIVGLHEVHQEFDDEEGDNEGRDAADQEDGNFVSREDRSELDDLQERGAQHDGHCQEEGELRRAGP